MKSIRLIIFYICLLLCSIIAISQENNDFKIGMYGFRYMPDTNNIGNECAYNYVIGGTHSQLNVLSEDGFNIVFDYIPCWWSLSKKFMRSYLNLIKKNNLQYMSNLSGFYKPTQANYYTDTSICEGMNVYDFNNGSSNCGARPSYNMLMDSVYFDNLYKDVIWGHQVCEEAAYRHLYASTNSMRQSEDDTNNTLYSEVPVDNISNAISHFKSKIDSVTSSQKLILMDAFHNGTVYDGMHDREIRVNKNDTNGFRKSLLTGDRFSYFQVDEYLRTIENKPDIYFEGSYIDLSFIHINDLKYDSTGHIKTYKDFHRNENYNNYFDTTYYEYYQHYLGGQVSMDWAYKYVNNVHKVVNIEYQTDSRKWKYSLCSDTNIQNGNFLWFEVYTSIIHNAKGIWFWDLNKALTPEEQLIWNNISPKDSSIYTREYFPAVYKNFVSPLARELRYLVNKNLISTDSTTYITSKTDKQDKYNLFRPYKCSISDMSALFSEFYNSDSSVNNHYNLRYSIRTNGIENLIIFTNPLLNTKCQTNIDLSEIAKQNDIIRNSKQCKLLFENFVPNDTTMIGSMYKTNRDYNNINLQDTTINDNYVQTITYDTFFSLAFGASDVHLLLFDSITNQYFDEKLDTTQLNYNNAAPLSQIQTDAFGKVYYIRNDLKFNYIDITNPLKQPEWLSGNIRTASYNSGFDIDKDNGILYYQDQSNRLNKINLYTNQSINISEDSNIDSNSRIFYHNNFIYCQRNNSYITRTDLSSGNTIIINSEIQSNKSIGFTIDKQNNELYFQAIDRCIYKINLNDLSMEKIYTSVPIKRNSNLHYDNNLYLIKEDNSIIHVLWQDTLGYHLDWLNSQAIVRDTTDFCVENNIVYYIGNNNLIYTIRNNQIDTLSPTMWVRGNKSTIFVDGENIFYRGIEGKIHKLQYRSKNFYHNLDLMIKDSPEDIGIEPNNNSEILFASNDIWIRNQMDGLTNQVTENPIYIPSQPVYVYVRIRNNSNYTSTGTERIRLSWTKAGADLLYPYTWNGSLTTSDNYPLGNIINEKTIPVISGGQEKIIVFEWLLPNPLHYNVDQWHYCLLAEILSKGEDTIHNFGQQQDTWIYVKNNNNVAWKNVTISNKQKTNSFISLYNARRRTYRGRLIFQSISEQGNISINDIANVILIPDSSLFENITRNIRTASGIRILNTEKRQLIITDRQASIEIDMLPNTLNLLEIVFDFNNKVSNKSKFRYNIILQNINRNIYSIGGEQYIIYNN